MLRRYISKLNSTKVAVLYSKMYSSKACIAVCQLTATNDKNQNLQTVKKLVTEAASKNAKMVFLPEACDFIGMNKEETKTLAEKIDGPTMNAYKTLAKENKIWLSIGGFHEMPENCDDIGKLCNSHVVINEEGNIVAKYRKLHLFDTQIEKSNIRLKESDSILGGCMIAPPISTPVGSVGLAICYDLRFPELSLILRKQGASILTYPSAFTHATGEAHWEVLLRARAIETQCYVVAAAQYGVHNEKRISYGRAMIVDPWGTIIAECPYYDGKTPTNESIAMAVIDTELIDKVRQEMQVFEHRRNDIYELKYVGRTSQTVADDETYMFANKIIPGSTVFYKSIHSYAFTNIRCVVPGHVLISTLRPARKLGDLSEDEVADLFQAVQKVQKAVENMYSASSSTICVQDGKDAGQTVPHVHVHVLPRKPGDFERNDDIYDCLAKHDREGSTMPIRDIAEMSEEARKLREYFS